MTRDKRSRRRSKLWCLANALLVPASLSLSVAFLWLHPDVAYYYRSIVISPKLNKEHIERRRQQQEEFFQRIRRVEKEGDGDEQANHQKRALFDYNLPPIATAETLQYPKANNAEHLIVLVLSARENAARRSMIRQTWGHDHAVYFVIGGPRPNITKHRSTTQETVQEQEAYHDLLDTIHPESYNSLPHKLKYAMHWVVHHCEAAQWIVKVDDDMFVRVDRLRDSFLPLLNPSTPTVVGHILRDIPVQRHGKWAETDYANPIYPPWPQGSCGYVVSRAVAEYIAQQYERDLAPSSKTTKTALRIYQGEDTSLGIWFEQSGLNVYWVNSPFFVNHGDCMVATDYSNGTTTDVVALSIGHRITPEQMQKCYAAFVDKEQDASTAAEQLYYLETHSQRTSPQQKEAGRSDNFFDDERLDETKTEAYRSAIARHQWEQEVANRQEYAKQRKEQRAKTRQQLRAGGFG
jgi:Galactosyltransferase